LENYEKTMSCASLNETSASVGKAVSEAKKGYKLWYASGEKQVIKKVSVKGSRGFPRLTVIKSKINSLFNFLQKPKNKFFLILIFEGIKLRTLRSSLIVS
jgi:hypothetical protein